MTCQCFKNSIGLPSETGPDGELISWYWCKKCGALGRRNSSTKKADIRWRKCQNANSVQEVDLLK